MKFLPEIIKGGFDIGGALIGANAQGKAADKQAEAIEKGIALQEKMYNQDRADFAPYRGLGAGTVGNLAYLGGITLPPPEAPPAQPPMSLADIGSHATGQMPWNTALQQSLGAVNQAEQAYQGPKVKVEYQGQTREIPATLLPRALAQGGRQVS